MIKWLLKVFFPELKRIEDNQKLIDKTVEFRGKSGNCLFEENGEWFIRLISGHIEGRKEVKLISQEREIEGFKTVLDAFNRLENYKKNES